MPVTMPALARRTRRRRRRTCPYAASGLSSRNGLPGSSSRSTRSRTSSLPRSVCFARALSEPPRRATASRSRSSSTSSFMSAPMSVMLAIINLTRYPRAMTVRGPRADPAQQILDTAAELFAAAGSTASASATSARRAASPGRRSTSTSPPRRRSSPRCWCASARSCSTVGRARVDAAGDARGGGRRAGRLARRLRPAPPRADRRPGPRLAVPARRDREQVRALQREYVDLWAAQLRRAAPGPARGPGPGHGARRLRPDQLHAAQRAAARSSRCGRC